MESTINPVSNEQETTMNEVPEASPVTGPDEEALRKLDIDTMFEKVKSKEAAFQEKNSQLQNKLQMLKADIMKKAFMMMRDLGVNLNDPESVSKFLQEMEAQDPDLLILFESAMSGLMPGEEIPQSGNLPAQDLMSDPSSRGNNLMEGATTNLQENILRKPNENQI